MKKLLLLVCCVFVFGCTNDAQPLQSLIDDPPSLIRDPDFQAYEEKKDELERAYLDDEIPYSEYVERKKMLDDQQSRKEQYYRNIVEGEVK